MEGIVVDVCAHPKIGGQELFHFFFSKRACCVACIARAFIVLLFGYHFRTPPLWAVYLDLLFRSRLLLVLHLILLRG